MLVVTCYLKVKVIRIKNLTNVTFSKVFYISSIMNFKENKLKLIMKLTENIENNFFNKLSGIRNYNCLNICV